MSIFLSLQIFTPIFISYKHRKRINSSFITLKLTVFPSTSRKFLTNLLINFNTFRIGHFFFFLIRKINHSGQKLPFFLRIKKDEIFLLNFTFYVYNFLQVIEVKNFTKNKNTHFQPSKFCFFLL